MSAVGNTPNYDLPQYTGDEKPSWLNDTNDAYMKIDLAIFEAKTIAQNAVDVSEKAVENGDKAIEIAGQATETIDMMQAEIDLMGERVTHIDERITEVSNSVIVIQENQEVMSMKLNDLDTDMRVINTEIGDLTDLTTPVKDNLVNAVNSAYTAIWKNYEALTIANINPLFDFPVGSANVVKISPDYMNFRLSFKTTAIVPANTLVRMFTCVSTQNIAWNSISQQYTIPVNPTGLLAYPIANASVGISTDVNHRDYIIITRDGNLNGIGFYLLTGSAPLQIATQNLVSASMLKREINSSQGV